MPISFGGAYGGGYDPAAAARERAAIDIANTRALMQARQQTYKNLGDDIGDAAKLYSTVQLKRQDQELQDRRERDARAERRQISDEAALLSSQQHVQSALQSLEKEHSDLIKEGKAWDAEAQASYMRERRAIQKLYADPNVSPRDKATIGYTILNRASANRPDLMAEGPLRAEDIEGLPSRKLVRFPDGTKTIVDVSEKNDPMRSLNQQRLHALESRKLALLKVTSDLSKSPRYRAPFEKELGGVQAQIDSLQGVPPAPAAADPIQEMGAAGQPAFADEFTSADPMMRLAPQQSAPDIVADSAMDTPTSAQSPIDPITGWVRHLGNLLAPDGYDADGNKKFRVVGKDPEILKAEKAAADAKKSEAATMKAAETEAKAKAAQAIKDAEELRKATEKQPDGSQLTDRQAIQQINSKRRLTGAPLIQSPPPTPLLWDDEPLSRSPIATDVGSAAPSPASQTAVSPGRTKLLDQAATQPEEVKTVQTLVDRLILAKPRPGTQEYKQLQEGIIFLRNKGVDVFPDSATRPKPVPAPTQGLQSPLQRGFYK